MPASDAFAGVAVLVALAAFIVAFWQGLLTRRHNRLSVTPHLSCQSHLGGTSGRFGLTVSNFGIGPARIKQVAVFVDDEKMEGSDDDGWEDAIDKLGIRELEPVYSPFEPGSALPPGNVTWLVSIPASGKWLQQEPIFEKALARLSLVIEYESFYGEAQILDTGTSEKQREKSVLITASSQNRPLVAGQFLRPEPSRAPTRRGSAWRLEQLARITKQAGATLSK